MAGRSGLVMSQGPGAGQTFPLEEGSIELGRGSGSDIVICHPQVSRRHARITRQGEALMIEDLGSSNGTFVNGVRLTGPHPLASGDVIGLGSAVLFTYYGADIAMVETLPGPPLPVQQPAQPLDRTVIPALRPATSPDARMTKNILLHGLTCLALGAVSLYLSYGPWTSGSWYWAYGAFPWGGGYRNLGGWREFMGLVFPVLFFMLAQRYLFKGEARKYWQAEPQLLSFYRYLFASGPKRLRIVCTAAVGLAVLYSAVLGPRVLFDEYTSAFSAYPSAIVPLSFAEHFRPYLAYLPYALTLYILIGLPLLIVVFEEIMADRRKIRRLAEPIWALEPGSVDVQAADEAVVRRALERKYRAELRQLRHNLATRFREGELKTLSFDLGIEYDDLPGEGRADKTRELVACLERRDRITDLIGVGRQRRPDIPWSDTLEATREALATYQGSGLERLTLSEGEKIALQGELVEASFLKVRVQIARVAGKYIYMALLVIIFFGIEFGSGLISQFTCWAQEVAKWAVWILIIVILPYFVATIFRMYAGVYRSSQDALRDLADRAIELQDEATANSVNEFGGELESKYTVPSFFLSLAKSVSVAVVAFLIALALVATGTYTRLKDRAAVAPGESITWRDVVEAVVPWPVSPVVLVGADLLEDAPSGDVSGAARPVIDWAPRCERHRPAPEENLEWRGKRIIDR